MRNALAAALLVSACGGSGDGKKAALVTPPAPPQPVTPTPTEQSDGPRDERRRMISLTSDELKWAPLDPNAGEGPVAAQLWGESSSPNGMFIKLPPGNPDVLHTHASDYHGVLVAGVLSNKQEGQKKPNPMPAQSYWFQPGGTAHTTVCIKGADCIIYAHWPLRFDYVVAQPNKAAKLDPRYVEKRVKDSRWQPLDAKNPKGPQLASLWGDAQSQPNGMLLKIRAGNAPFWHIHKFDYHGVVLAGTINNIESGSDAKDLPVGSYWMQPAGYKHTTNCKAGGPDCLVYVHFEGAFDIKAVE